MVTALALIVCVALPGLALAYTYRCPRPDGATQIIQNNRYIAMRGIDLFDGHPDEMAQLKPDNGDTRKLNEPAVWTTADISPRAYWMVCNYDKSIRYLRRLNALEKQCVEIMGGTVPLGLECK